MSQPRFERLGLMLVPWERMFEGMYREWLRRADLKGMILPFGAERAWEAEVRAELLAAKLQEVGCDPGSARRSARVVPRR